jgi:hypothetical protein
MIAPGNLCVVHLVRHANGWEPFDRFMRSYRQNQAGINHDFVAVFKGFPSHEVPAEYRALLGEHGDILTLDDDGFDIGSYWAAARVLPYRSFCFLNSFSVILDPGWLAKMAQHHVHSVGLVGASGSWEIHHPGSDGLLPAVVLPPWRRAKPPLPPRRLTPRDRAWAFREYLECRRKQNSIPRFPNPHIRTNAFLIRRDLMLEVGLGPMSSKWQALLFESGKHSLTRQIAARGLETLVVGRDSLAYPPERWEQSHTFRSGEQNNLLVSDNRTEEWATSESPLKEQLAAEAWGNKIFG